MESLLADSDSCTTFFFFGFWKQKFWECHKALSIVYVCLKASNSMPQKLKTKFEASPMGWMSNHGTITKRPLKLRVIAFFFFFFWGVKFQKKKKKIANKLGCNIKTTPLNIS